MEKTLLDTDILSEILKQKHVNVVKKAMQYKRIYNIFTLSTITVLEIVKGFHKVNLEDKLLKFLSMANSAQILTLSMRSAEIGGRIYADLERAGKPIGRADPMIAAIAIEHEMTLSTGNLNHYQRIIDLGYDLKIDNWKSD